MHGAIQSYDDLSGAGTILGEDNTEYAFRLGDMKQPQPLRAGDRVRFTPNGASAAYIDVIDARGRAVSITDDNTPGERLSMWGYFLKAVRMSFNGNGRARRLEYWSFVLFQLLVLGVPALIAALVVGAFADQSYTSGSDSGFEVVGGLLLLVVGLAWLALIPARITIMVRRLHDVGMSGWLYLLVILPYIGDLFLLVVSLIPGQDRANQYGPNPKNPPHQDVSEVFA